MITSSIICGLLAGIVVAAPFGEPLQPSRTSLVVSRKLQQRSGDKEGSAAAKWNSNVELLTEIQIAGKSHHVVLDTGSADMWMFCTEGDDHMETGRSVYSPVTGRKMTGSKFDIKYGKGHADGDVYSDKVSIGNITVDQAIGCAKDVSQDDINDRAMDGIIGLGFDSGTKVPHNGHDAEPSATRSALNSVTTKGGGVLGLFQSQQPNAQGTWIENAFPQLKEGLFTVDFKKGEDGVYNFGFIDKSRFSTTLTYMPVIHWNHWVVQVGGYQVGKNGSTKTAKRKALIDTGSTNILVDDVIAKEYFEAVPTAKKNGDNWLVPCNQTIAQMPDFQLNFEPPAAANLNSPVGSGGIGSGPYTASVPGIYLIGNQSGKKDEMCQASISQSDKGNGWDIILGDAFLISQLVVFDAGSSNGNKDKSLPSRGQIGFAPKPEGPTDNH